MLAQLSQRGENDWRANEQNWLVLQGGHDDFMGRANTVDIGGTIRDREVARIDHSQVDVQRFPKLSRAPGPRLGSCFADFVGPALANAFAALDVFASVFVQAANVRFEPWIEYSHAHRLQKLADAVAPARLFLGRARRDKIHRSG